MSITYHKSRDIQCLRQTTTTRDIEKENSLNELMDNTHYEGTHKKGEGWGAS